jgi:hypothetical protein
MNGLMHRSKFGEIRVRVCVVDRGRVVTVEKNPR